MSGIEAAGLALAIFPIVVQGVGCYLDGCQKLSETKKYKWLLKQLERKLDVERVKFENTCGTLLEGLVSEDQMEDLLRNPVAWKDEKLHKSLESERLRAKNILVFVESVEELKSLLEELSDSIGIERLGLSVNPETKIPWHSFQLQWSKLKLVIDAEKHKSILDEIRRINEDLLTLTTQRPRKPPVPIIRTEKSVAAEKYNRVRGYAQNLYDAFHHKFHSASCLCAHNAALRLEDHSSQDDVRLRVLMDFEYRPKPNICAPAQLRYLRDRSWLSLECEPVRCVSESPEKSNGSSKPTLDVEPPPNSRERSPARSSLGKIRDAFNWRLPKSSPKKECRVKFTALPEKEDEYPKSAKLETVPETVKRIEDLCADVGSAFATRSSEYIGVLVGVSSDHTWHRIWPPPPPRQMPYQSARYLPEPATLSEILYPGAFDLCHRLELGLKIAHAVMELHGTPWLGENWSSKNIYFLQNEGTARTRTQDGRYQNVTVLNPIIDKPFVRRIFDSNQEFAQLDRAAEVAIDRSLVQDYDTSLFALGIVLMELCLERPIEELREERIQNSTPSRRSDNADLLSARKNADYAIVKHFFGEVRELAGDSYSNAMWSCISGLDYMGRTLDDDGFKSAVHEKIVCLLQKNFELFSNPFDQRRR